MEGESPQQKRGASFHADAKNPTPALFAPPSAVVAAAAEATAAFSAATVFSPIAKASVTTCLATAKSRCP